MWSIPVILCIFLFGSYAQDQLFFPGLKQFDQGGNETVPVEEEVDPNFLLTIKDFAEYYDLELPAPKISTRTGFGKPPTITLPQAGCIAENQPVALDLPREVAMDYFPKCVRVKRCGGCCTVEGHECQPVETETLTVEAVKFNQGATRRTRRNRRVRRTTDYIPVKVEQHLTCKCDCKIKAEDCNVLQKYDPNQCACVCLNQDEEEQCSNSSDHFWRQDICQCHCRATVPCTTGFTFSQKSCQCER